MDSASAASASDPPPLYPYRRSPDQDADPVAFHPVVVVGAGPIGLAAAIDLAQHDVPVVVLDDNDRVSGGSRAICFAKRPLEILDRLGCGDAWWRRRDLEPGGRSSSTAGRSTASTCCPRRATSGRRSSTCSSTTASSISSSGCAPSSALASR